MKDNGLRFAGQHLVRHLDHGLIERPQYRLCTPTRKVAVKPHFPHLFRLRFVSLLSNNRNIMGSLLLLSFLLFSLTGFAQSLDMQWEQHLEDEHVQDVFSVEPLPDGGFLVVGASNGLGTEAQVWRLHSNGDTAWSKDYDAYYRFNDIAPANGGHYILSGITKIDFHNSLVKMDANGEILASNQFNLAAFNELDVHDGDIYASGAYKETAVIFQVNGDADTVKKWSPALTTGDSVFNTFIVTSDNGFLVSQPLQDNYLSISKVDTQGDTVWSVQDTGKSHIIEFREHPSGEYYALSNKFRGVRLHRITASGDTFDLKKARENKEFYAFAMDGNFLIAAGSIGRYPYVELMDLNGDSIDSYTYTANIDLSENSNFTDIERIGTGEYIAVGEAYHPNSKSNLLAVKFGESTGVNLITASVGPEIKIYPNPSDGDVNIEIPGPGMKEINIFDALGNEIVTSRIEHGHLHISAAEWPTGFYFVEVILNGGKTIKRFVKN